MVGGGRGYIQDTSSVYSPFYIINNNTMTSHYLENIQLQISLDYSTIEINKTSYFKNVILTIIKPEKY